MLLCELRIWLSLLIVPHLIRKLVTVHINRHKFVRETGNCIVVYRLYEYMMHCKIHFANFMGMKSMAHLIVIIAVRRVGVNYSAVLIELARVLERCTVDDRRVSVHRVALVSSCTGRY